MNPQELSIIGIRIVAIYLIAQGFIQFSGFMASYISLSLKEELFISGACFALAPLLFGILLWLCSTALSRLVVDKSYHVEESKPINSLSLQAIALSTVGLVLVFTALPALIGQLIRIFSEAPVFEGKRTYDLALLSLFIGQLLKVILGVTLVLGANFWARFLSWFQKFGLQSKHPDE